MFYYLLACFRETRKNTRARDVARTRATNGAQKKKSDLTLYKVNSQPKEQRNIKTPAEERKIKKKERNKRRIALFLLLLLLSLFPAVTSDFL